MLKGNWWFLFKLKHILNLNIVNITENRHQNPCPEKNPFRTSPPPPNPVRKYLYNNCKFIQNYRVEMFSVTRHNSIHLMDRHRKTNFGFICSFFIWFFVVTGLNRKRKHSAAVDLIYEVRSSLMDFSIFYKYKSNTAI